MLILDYILQEFLINKFLILDRRKPFVEQNNVPTEIFGLNCKFGKSQYSTSYFIL